jgi:hypothetical protein
LPSIGCSPSQMLFGFATDNSNGIFQEFSRREQTEMNLSDYVKPMLNAQSRMIKKAQKLLQSHESTHKSTAPKETTEFDKNSYVLMMYPSGPSRHSQPPSKLLTNWKGPLQVVSHDGPNYKLRNILTHKVRANAVHISRLKQFLYDPAKTSPRDAARRDLQEFVIHEIREHKPLNNQHKQDMLFRVRWLGYGAADDTWEPWQGLRNTKALHRYLHEQAKDTLIPPEHRRESYEDSDDEDEE